MSACVRVLSLIGLILIVGPALAGWQEAYETGDMAWCVVADPVHQAVYVGTSVGLVHLDVPSGHWSTVQGGPTDPIWDIAWHPTQSGSLVFARGAWTPATLGRIERSDDLGATVDTVLTFPADVFCGDLERDPSDPDHLLATTWTFLGDGGMVFGSEDGGAHWQLLEQAERADRYCVAVNGAGHIYIGGEDGVRRSLDGGASWESAQGDLPAGDVNCLRAMPEGAAGHLFACTNEDLFETLDGGQHWAPILWGVRTTDLVIHPTVPAIMAAHILLDGGPADEVPLTFDGGQTWDWSWYFAVAIDWGAYHGMAISTADNRIYATNMEFIYTYDLGATAVASAPAAQPRLVAFPNPFNPATEIRLDLPATSAVSLRILDSAGRLQRTLLNRVPHAGGELRVAWNGCDEAGRRLPSGVYHYQLEAAGERATGKLTLLK